MLDDSTKGQPISTRARGRLLMLVLPAALAGACAEPSTPVSVSSATLVVDQPSFNATLGDEVARLRNVTARFHRIEAAGEAQYGKFTDCMEKPGVGGMGLHYAKGSAVADGVVDPDNPEVLVYEPESNGTLRLVAVEFAVPYTAAPREGPAPKLFGMDMRRNDTFQIWARHAWIWKNNPAGMFEDWNPNVSCAAVEPSARMSH